MSTQSNAAREWPEAPQAGGSVMSATRPFYWSVRRELWENRWIYLGPLGAAAVFLFGFLVSTVHLPTRMRALSSFDPMHYHEAVATPYDIIAGLMMAACIIVTVFYCADALYSERRDRSILFWKSLPVSDRTTVLAKASIPFIVLPLLACTIAIASQFIMLLVSSAVLLGSGQSAAPLWTTLSFGRMSWLMIYHIWTAHTLWPAPVYCWLLLVSAWARRAPFLWAVLPPFAIGGLEKIVFHSWHFAEFVASRFIGNTEVTATSAPHIFPTDPMTHITPGMFLSSPSLWIGLLISAAFLAAAVRLRRYREPV